MTRAHHKSEVLQLHSAYGHIACQITRYEAENMQKDNLPLHKTLAPEVDSKSHAFVLKVACFCSESGLLQIKLKGVLSATGLSAVCDIS